MIHELLNDLARGIPNFKLMAKNQHGIRVLSGAEARIENAMRRKRYYRRLGERCGVGMHCWYCGKRLISRHKSEWTMDHQYPRAFGGGKGDNLVLACATCNGQKGCMDLETYRAHLSLDLPQGERVIFYGESNTC